MPASSGNHIFFAPRGSESFPGYALLDTSINYTIPVFRSARPWLKLDVYNVLNNRKLIAWNTAVTQNRAGALDARGIATTFIRGAAFGTASGNTVTNLDSTALNAYPVAFTGSSAEAPAGGRTVRVALGFRF